MIDRAFVMAKIQYEKSEILSYGLDTIGPIYEEDEVITYLFTTDREIYMQFIFDEETGALGEIEISAHEFEDSLSEDGDVIYCKDIDDFREKDIDDAIKILMSLLKPEEYKLLDIKDCPICEAKLENDFSSGSVDFDLRDCVNKCYSVELASVGDRCRYTINIADTQEIYYYDNTEKRVKDWCNNFARHRIAYWRRNNRYLVRIMEG